MYVIRLTYYVCLTTPARHIWATHNLLARQARAKQTGPTVHNLLVGQARGPEAEAPDPSGFSRGSG